MTWSLHASGHAEGPEAEAALIAELRKVLGGGAASYANIGTQHHGSVNLTAAEDPAAEPEPPHAPPAEPATSTEADPASVETTGPAAVPDPAPAEPERQGISDAQTHSYS